MSLTDALPDAATESGSGYDGLFSYAGEYHAFIMGLFVGFVTGATQRWELAAAFAGVVLNEKNPKQGGLIRNTVAIHEIRAEAWYAAGGFLIGAVAGLITNPVQAVIGVAG